MPNYRGKEIKGYGFKEQGKLPGVNVIVWLVPRGKVEVRLFLNYFQLGVLLRLGPFLSFQRI
jgi:hypothetical protein